MGIDLTQNKPVIGFASFHDKADCLIPENSPPAVLLPAFVGESLIAGPNAHKHRRGIGLNWPPESQVPVSNEGANGTGRIPLIWAWNKLALLSQQQFSGIIGDTEVAWRPPGKNKQYSTAEKLIAQSAVTWAKYYSSKKAVLVVPDSLGEAAQQAILDNTPDSFLIPRPIAVAMSWCRSNAKKISMAVTKHKEGTTIGHLLVITMSYDQWELVPIEIRAREYRDQIWFIPIRSRVVESEIPRIGLHLFFALAGTHSSELTDLWYETIGSGKVNLEYQDWNKVKNNEKLIKECLTKGFCNTRRTALYDLNLLSDLFAHQKHFSPYDFKSSLEILYHKQLELMPGEAKKMCLGAVIDGACSLIPIAESRTLGQFVASAFQDIEFSILGGTEASIGAALTAYAIEQKLPSYRETIIPIDIHYHGRNENGDFVNCYKPLVEGTTVGAGDEYRSKEPITGLRIKQGENNLKLTLRRSSGIAAGEYNYRKVSAVIPQQTQKDEEVEIKVNLLPGQGFAKVYIDSVNEGIFNTLLNWRSMEECDEPEPPPLAYLPEVSRVVQDEYIWQIAESYIEDAIRALKFGSDITEAMQELRVRGKFNQWPMADSYDEFRGRTPMGDIFRHYGVCPSNGDFRAVSDSELLEELAAESAKVFVSSDINRDQKNKIQQTISWMYLACPPVILHSARKNLKQRKAQTQKVDLDTIGLCWNESDDIKLFFKAFEERLLQGIQGVNNWLRACRNIVRFRDAALQLENIPEKNLENIISRILRILRGQIEERNFQRIFDNCILTCLYLLKRRRYDNEFLSVDSYNYDELDFILTMLQKDYSRSLSDRRSSIVQVTQKFLRKQANIKDLDSSVLEG